MNSNDNNNDIDNNNDNGCSKGNVESEVEFEDGNTSDIVILEAWNEASNTITFHSNKTPIVLICGPKNTGKSTFSRHLLNTLLINRYKRVAYLDTDVGQPEFTTPGCLSLHLINECTQDLKILSLKTPERCFFFGDTSSKRDPEAYLDCFICLYNFFRQKYYQLQPNHGGNVQLPLIINTPGWVKGVGYDILVEMLRHASPTHVVQMRISSEKKNLPRGPFWLDRDHNEHVNLIETYATFRDAMKPMRKDAGLLRDTRIMAYFKQCFPSGLNIKTSRKLAHALASHPPYVVPISKIKIMHPHCQVADNELLYSLNATIVGLAVSRKTKSSRPWCVGLGLVRAVDTLRGLLYIITPVLPCMLEKVDILLQGFIEIPTHLMQVGGCMSPYIATHVLPPIKGY